MQRTEYLDPTEKRMRRASGETVFLSGTGDLVGTRGATWATTRWGAGECARTAAMAMRSEEESEVTLENKRNRFGRSIKGVRALVP